MKKKNVEKADFFTIGVVGKFIPVKRIGKVIETVSELNDVRLEIVGAGFLEDSYRNLIEELDVGDRVEIVGWVENKNLDEYYSRFDVTVCFSEWETWCMPITESYLCGTPCISTDVGGPSDQILNGETGYLVNNKAELKEKIKKLRDNPDLVSEFGRKGKKFIQRFTMEEIKRKSERFFKEVLTK